MGEVEVTQQPIFYLFIAATILLTLGYSWGHRGNKRIFLSAFNALVDTLKPKDQSFTKIGGETGYHANLIPKKNSFIRRVDATITLLPRQSWLYLPFSLLTFRFDRLFLMLFFSKKAMGLVSEGHLIEEKYSRFRGPKITNEDQLQKEELRWGEHDFLLYYADDAIKKDLLNLKQKLKQPKYLRHIAVVPDREQAFLFMIPKKGYVAEAFPVIYKWLNNMLEQKRSKKAEARGN
ncbi:MAG: hypothetical protein U5P10_00770 [Spirochaetia bacterium]|nr:hypothetical protein [Spirochaetia bacterium]